MSCCVAGGALNTGAYDTAPNPEEVRHLSQDVGEGLLRTVLAVPEVHCGACISSIEGALADVGAVQEARVNLSSKRLSIVWRSEDVDLVAILSALTRVGFSGHLISATAVAADRTQRELLIALGLSGFAAANIMLLSVSVWSGAEGTTRDLFHWVSALIAIPTVGYAGRIFFRPALAALRRGRLSMEVPISLALILAILISLYETATHGAHAYFDASVSLLFFLLLGRTVDHALRERARGAVVSLARMAPEGATVLDAEGRTKWTPLEDVTPGDRLLVRPGDRFPVDGTVLIGNSDVDAAIATGESVPVPVCQGDTVVAGALNLTGPIEVTANAAASGSFLAEMMRLLEAAEISDAKYRRLSDRAAAIYAPVVHLLALFAFIGWVWVTGDWQKSALTAVSVLIITCPCALALAVPMVQIAGATRLYRAGIMMRDGAALEKLAGVGHVVFDKTGTVTEGVPRLRDAAGFDAKTLDLAVGLARKSRHPYSAALVAVAEERGLGNDPIRLSDIQEYPGRGLQGMASGSTIRLGRPNWALGRAIHGDEESEGVSLTRDGEEIARFRFDDAPREDAAAAVQGLRAQGLETEILSGDHRAVVRRCAEAVGIERWAAGLSPQDKLDRIEAVKARGDKVLMVGDGLNDTPAMVAADIAMVPANASEVGRQSAGFVFLRGDLSAVPVAVAVARRARALIFQNFGLAVAYNAIAIPIAVLGYASPLVAALAMSGSSILVTVNALRLMTGDLRPLGGNAACAPAPADPAASGSSPARVPSNTVKEAVS